MHYGTELADYIKLTNNIVYTGIAADETSLWSILLKLCSWLCWCWQLIDLILSNEYLFSSLLLCIDGRKSTQLIFRETIFLCWHTSSIDRLRREYEKSLEASFSVQVFSFVCSNYLCSDCTELLLWDFISIFEVETLHSIPISQWRAAVRRSWCL